MLGTAASQVLVTKQKKLFGENKAVAESFQFLPLVPGIEWWKGKGKSRNWGY